ncbi:hypothetical protein T07_2316 [Trichinella nelsoni]|uniref:Uncharacterized protein n=1 Tax=Trichinella nelsoni TaxID=6336 RepID=A0A0V0RG86_9BILA|nr:hypothetical protein T07_2316 [Trichinella nelsoni]
MKRSSFELVQNQEDKPKFLSNNFLTLPIKTVNINDLKLIIINNLQSIRMKCTQILLSMSRTEKFLQQQC